MPAELGVLNTETSYDKWKGRTESPLDIPEEWKTRILLDLPCKPVTFIDIAVDNSKDKELGSITILDD